VDGSCDDFVDEELARAGCDPTASELAEIRGDVIAFLASPLGRKLRALPSDARRPELPFQLKVDAPPHACLLQGQFDLLYWDDGGPVVLDYKYARASAASLASYQLQLDTYALAAAELCNFAGPVRTQLVFLRDRAAPHERMVTPALRAGLVDQIGRITTALAEQRVMASTWPGRERSVCEAAACGFMGRCWGEFGIRNGQSGQPLGPVSP
jgi:hypothetical protein